VAVAQGGRQHEAQVRSIALAISTAERMTLSAFACRRSRLSGHDSSENQHDRQVQQSNQIEQNGRVEQVRHEPPENRHDRQVEQYHQIEQVRPDSPLYASESPAATMLPSP
jgi:hypothetical protein